MPSLYLPQSKELSDKLKGLGQGFLIEFFEDDKATLFLKFNMSILSSIIRGCDLRLGLLNPNLPEPKYFVYIYDHPKNPFWAQNKGFNVSDNIADEIKKIGDLKEIRVSLLNELSAPVFSFSEELCIDSKKWFEWLDKCSNNNCSPDSTEFEINIPNKDHRHQEKITTIVNFIDGFNTEKFKSVVNLNDFVDNGTHGYIQEESIKNILSIHFEINRELFISPVYENENEFCDFVILLDKSVILIESKFIISPKPTKIAAGIQKGVEQLFKINAAIFGKNLKLKDKYLQTEILKKKYPLKIVVFNGALNLTQNRLSSWLSSYENKAHLPMFMPVETLSQFLNFLLIEYSSSFKGRLEKELLSRFNYYYFHPEGEDYLFF